MWPAVREWIYQVTIALDQLVNTFVNGAADETMSSRIYRLNTKQPYKSLEKIVNAIFYLFQGPEHCRNAYYKELRGRHLSADFYDRAYEMDAEFNARQ